MSIPFGIILHAQGHSRLRGISERFNAVMLRRIDEPQVPKYAMWCCAILRGTAHSLLLSRTYADFDVVIGRKRLQSW